MTDPNVFNTWHWFAPDEFASRRKRVAEHVGSGEVAVLQGAGPIAGFDLFRQDNDFFYLSGVSIPQAYLTLDRHAATLYLPQNAIPEAVSPGIGQVLPLEALQESLAAAKAIWTPHSYAENRMQAQDSLRHAAKLRGEDPWDVAPSRRDTFIRHIGERCPRAEIRDLAPILDAMRLVKSPAEIAVLRFAGRLAAEAVSEAMKITKPGRNECELGAIAEYTYRLRGARGEGYRPIIPNGPNVWHGHYCDNDKALVAGEIILMDGAPDVCGYTSDIGRMFPVDGRYSPLHRELYGFMVDYHLALLQRIKPGRLPADVLADAAQAMAQQVERTRFSKPIYEEAARRALEFKGHLSHPVGMAVHDVGRYFDRPMPEGLVITIDPQMWVPEEKLYIRVEDTIAVTHDGIEVLTDGAPLNLDDVEALMREPGLID